MVLTLAGDEELEVVRQYYFEKVLQRFSFTQQCVHATLRRYVHEVHVLNCIEVLASKALRERLDSCGLLKRHRDKLGKKGSPKVIFFFYETTPSQLEQDDVKKKRFAAAAAAYVAVHVNGSAVVSLKDADAVILGARRGEF